MRYTDKIVHVLGQIELQTISFAKVRRSVVLAVLCAGYVAGMFFGYFLSR